ncbi:hypothetical protein DFJ58DRAFT_759600 [Suillus subalutaceus]|uniref:uncharacterized protein n=1 Tax=Suillus subalutaceus TaxID=48586 RepID=UPI001B85EF69|nr:uncharacterized protein DFJ58DRAFT_759600 [Suillus subalutaceus]KAG1873659.1 hypothetical protein DFJ58DRAFT_759600 [Suillus subalutaceus]
MEQSTLATHARILVAPFLPHPFLMLLCALMLSSSWRRGVNYCQSKDDTRCWRPTARRFGCMINGESAEWDARQLNRRY